MEELPPVMSDTSEEEQEQENKIEKPKRVRKPLSAEQKGALVKRLAEGRAKRAAAKNKEFINENIENEVIGEVEQPVVPKIAKAKPVKAVKVVKPVIEPLEEEEAPPKRTRKPKTPKEAPTTIITNNYYEKPVEKKAKSPRKPKKEKEPPQPTQPTQHLPQPTPMKSLVFV